MEIQLIIPRLPALDLAETAQFYTSFLAFEVVAQYDAYLILSKDKVELHFYLHPTLRKKANDSMIYLRTTDIETLYESLKSKGAEFPEAGHLTTKPWGQQEFAILDTNANLLTFGQAS